MFLSPFPIILNAAWFFFFFFTSAEPWAEVFMTLSIITPTSHNLWKLRAHPLICDVGILFPRVHYFMFIHFESCLSFYYLISQSHRVLLQSFTAIAHLYYEISLTTFASFLTLPIIPWFRSAILTINITDLNTVPCRTALVFLCCKSWLCIAAFCLLSS